MESEQHCYELRSGSRSRSQTPLVQNRALVDSEPTERHYNLRSQSRERSRTPGEVTSTRRSGSRSLPSSVGKVPEQSMETISEQKEEVIKDVSSDNQSNKPDGITSIATRKTERRSERQKARRQIFLNGQNEMNEHSSDPKSAEKRKSVSPHRVLTSDYSSEEGEREDPPSRFGSAYEIYKQAGDWWNVFPKTDYTYSQKSQCRYEIAPGVLAMPNMSRRSIHSDGNSTTGSVQSVDQHNLSHSSQERTETVFGETEQRNAQDFMSSDQPHELLVKTRNWDFEVSDETSHTMYTRTHVEQYKCHREIFYTVPGSLVNARQRHVSCSDATSGGAESRKYTGTSQADSDAELDEAVSITRNKSDERWNAARWLSSLTTVFVLWLGKTYEFLNLRTVGRRNYRAAYVYQRSESKWNIAWRYVDRSLQYVYLFMVQIFLLDSWLLSRVSGLRTQLQQKGPIVVWIAFLPLLLLSGCWCLPYLSALFPLTEEAARQTHGVAPIENHASFTEDTVGRKENLRTAIEKLSGTIDILENRNVEQAGRLSNISHALEELKESTREGWTRYDNKIIVLEDKLSERKSTDTNAYQIEEIKLELESLKKLCLKLQSDCSAHSEFIANENLEKHVGRVINDYIGATVSKDDFSRIVKNFKTMDDNEYSKRARIGEVPNAPGIPEDVLDERVREIVKQALKIYDADKTGRVDYALESAGGQIISTRCTQRYDIKTRAFKLLAFTLYHENNNPRTVIQGNPIQPGACWAFQGFPGYLLIKLRGFIYVTGFTVEHAPKSILPNEEMRSAPRKFNVWGFVEENDPEPVMLGDYEFAASDENLQYFPLQNTEVTMPFEYIELRVHSNHGQLEYTCLYRFRVHGRSI